MAAEPTEDSASCQAQVLQNTLAEISVTRVQCNNSPFVQFEPAAPLECCVICLDSVSDRCIANPCEHANFDFSCLASWLQAHKSCPLCKAAIATVNYNFTADGKCSVYRVPDTFVPKTTTTSTPTANSAIRPFTESAPWLVRPRRPYNRHRAPPTTHEILARRRHVYRHNLYSLHIGSNRNSRYRDAPTPAQFASTPHLVARARTWIRRELQVFAFLSVFEEDYGERQQRRVMHAEFLLEYLVAILKTVDLQGSMGAAEDMLADFLGRKHAKLFLHELRSWLRSPFVSLAEWDRAVQHPEVGEAGRRKKYGGGESNDGEGLAEGDASERTKASPITRPRDRSYRLDRTHEPGLSRDSRSHTKRGGPSPGRGDFWRPFNRLCDRKLFDRNVLNSTEEVSSARDSRRRR